MKCSASLTSALEINDANLQNLVMTMSHLFHNYFNMVLLKIKLLLG